MSDNADLQVILQARRGQGVREMQQCYERLQEVQMQLEAQEVCQTDICAVAAECICSK